MQIARCFIEFTSKVCSGGKFPFPIFPLRLLIHLKTWPLGSFHCYSTLLILCFFEVDYIVCKTVYETHC